MSFKTRKILRLILLSISIIIFTIIAVYLVLDKLNGFDSLVYNFIIKYRSNYLTSFFKFITFFASIEWILIVMISTLLFNKNKKINLVLLVYLSIIIIINLILKNIFGRIRPLDLMIIDELGYSFPSGHSAISLAFYGFIGYLVYKSKIRRNKKIALIIFLLTISFLIGLSRIYLGVHYASDVLAGFMLAIGYLCIFTNIYKIEKEVIL